MYSLAMTFLITFVASLLLTPPVRALAWRCRALDRPDGVRKTHRRPTPRWGGVAVYAAFVLGLLLARHGTYATGPALDELVKLLIPVAGFVCLVGAIDDYRHLPARVKLVLQIVAALPLVLLHCWIDRIVVFGQAIDLGWLGVPLTVLWLVGCINALNLLDGMDGLASLVGLSTAVMMGLIATSEGHPEVGVIAIVLAGTLAGFLVYNLPPATIFLGDSGSLVIGLVVGMLSIQGGLKTSATMSITAPAVVMSLPMFDVVLAVIRRHLTGRRFDTADRQHIHHRLLDRGLTPWQVLCVLGALCLLTGAAATMATLFRSDTLAWVTTLTLLAAAMRMRLFGDHEFLLVKRAVLGGLAQLAARVLPSSIYVPRSAELEVLTADEVWDLLAEELRPWHVQQLEWTVQPEEEVQARRHWTLAQPADVARCGWSLGVCFHRPGGVCCELRASVLRAPPPESWYLVGLIRILQAFGARLATLSPPKPQHAAGRPPRPAMARSAGRKAA